MDWSREQFTMDPHFTKAVVKVFVDLHKEGLIYRDKRLVNWDPLKTAISDLEVETREVQGGFWHFKYPLADGVRLDDGRDYIEVATTRPETMLADMAVAVNPEDERYKSVIGKEILQPITGRRFRIVADEHADPELGSGAVKITPGHDFNDFEVGKRAGSPPTPCSTCSMPMPMWCRPPMAWSRAIWASSVSRRADGGGRDEGAGLPHPPHHQGQGRQRRRARRRAAHHPDPFGDRGGVVIEPWLTDQWYVNAAVLAQKPIEAVKSGAIEIVPKAGKRPSSTGWKTSSRGASASFGGASIPAWYAEDGRFSWPKRGGSAGSGGQQGADPRSRRARHLVLLGSVALCHAGLAG
jgi:valyl-tRNA synthetase